MSICVEGHCVEGHLRRRHWTLPQVWVSTNSPPIHEAGLRCQEHRRRHLMTLTVAEREEFLRLSSQNEKLDSLICFKHPGPSPRVPSLPVAMAKVNNQGPQRRHRKAHRAPRSKNLKHKPHKTPIPRAQKAKNNCAMAFLGPSRFANRSRNANRMHSVNCSESTAYRKNLTAPRKMAGSSSNFPGPRRFGDCKSI